MDDEAQGLITGYGKDVQVRPIRYTGPGGGTWAGVGAGIEGACRDSAVAVLILEIWNRLDVDGNGVVSAAERANHAANAPGTAATLQPAINFCRNPYLDWGTDGVFGTMDADGSEGDGAYQLGEPFSDTDGDGLYNATRDGKILAAPLGNDGENLNLLEIPSTFVPASPHPAAAPYVFGFPPLRPRNVPME